MTVQSNIPTGAIACLLRGSIINAQRNGTFQAHLVLDAARAVSIESLLRLTNPEINCIILDGWDCLPYDRIGPSADAQANRNKALKDIHQLQHSQVIKPTLVLYTVNAACLLSPPVLNTHTLHVATGQKMPQDSILTYLNSIGYERTDIVRTRGEFSVRGGLLDVFPSNTELPIRIDFFGDNIESISSFEPDSQLSLTKITSIDLAPIQAVSLSAAAIETFRRNYRAHFGVSNEDPLYQAISAGNLYAGIDHWLPLFFEAAFDSVFKILNGASLSADFEAIAAVKDQIEQVQDLYKARKSFLDNAPKGQAPYKPIQPDLLYLPQTDFDRASAQFTIYQPYSDGFTKNATYKNAYDFVEERAAPNDVLIQALSNQLKTLTQQSRRVLIACHTKGSAERLNVLLKQHYVENAAIIQTAEDFSRLKQGAIGLWVAPHQQGFESADLSILTEENIFGTSFGHSVKKSRKASQFLREISSLSVDDLVVHTEHGIGRFIGLQIVEAGGTRHDCLTIEYAGGDKLFVPVENISVLSRYGNEESTIALDKLGGVSWQSRKAKVKKNLLEMAGKLIEIASARTLSDAPVFDVKHELYQSFCTRFPYAETEDQLSSISEVEKDLMSGRPMDRLVCGDVGFGKTEIALRAAAIVALNNAQVAVIAPTTLLCRQHFENFTRRFAGLPVSIVQLSRFVSAKQLAENKKSVANGSARIVIGTHALLAASMQFSNLGLVVVDEEQHFGVKQKERLKDLRKNVHVLTLTATPIPRTLQLSLTGVRDMSLITTPPVDRLAVNTHVMPFDPLIMREALLREHHRGGQSFIVCPHIADLEEALDFFKQLVPEVKFITAHGQLTPSDLEDRMTAFYERKYEVLMATNIIESGLDIPTANTLIVLRADRFGLAQLYQIRGRVGRSKLRAHAYITWPEKDTLTEQGKRRLHILSTLEGLGAGFQLASHDLDLRGGGNLLGEQQHGHIREVGIELYQSLLEEAVTQAKAGLGPNAHTLAENAPYIPNITLGVSVVMPETYIPDLSVRLSLYRRLADLKTDFDIDKLAAEMIDRFGPLPEDVETLCTLMKIRLLCLTARISDLDAGPKGVLVSFKDNTPKDVGQLMAYIQKNAGLLKLRPDQKLFYPRSLTHPSHRIAAAKSIALQLSQL